MQKKNKLLKHKLFNQMGLSYLQFTIQIKNKIKLFAWWTLKKLKNFRNKNIRKDTNILLYNMNLTNILMLLSIYQKLLNINLMEVL
jgi:hypothetical protein